MGTTTKYNLIRYSLLKYSPFNDTSAFSSLLQDKTALEKIKKDTKAWPTYRVESEWGISRLDTYLRKNIGLEFSLVQKLIRMKKIFVNGIKQKEAIFKVKGGDEVVIKMNHIQDFRLKYNKVKEEIKAKQLPFDIIFKNKQTLVINKPNELAVQDGSKIKDHIVKYLESLKFEYQNVPRIVHRLDKDVSGVLILARTHNASVILSRMFHADTMINKTNDEEINKYYIAIVHNTPKESKGIINLPIYYKHNQASLLPYKDSQIEKQSLTEYKVLKSNRMYSVLFLKLITGRKHQLRIHLANGLYTSIVGDTKYSKLDTNNRLMLHCLAMDIKNDEIITEEDYDRDVNLNFVDSFIKDYLDQIPKVGLRVVAPLPAEFHQFINKNKI